MAEVRQNVQRADVFEMPWGTGKSRLVVVISRDSANGGDCAVVVPFTSQRLDERRNFRSCVFFPADHRFTCDCIAKTDEISRVLKTEFNWKKNRLFRLTPPEMQKIVEALRWLVRDETLP